MHSSESLFARLARLGRHGPEVCPADDLPPALATRVLARLRDPEPEAASPLERLSLRALPFAAAAAAGCLFFGLRPAPEPETDERGLARTFVQNQLDR